ncbi:MAG: OmpH family outer membrane protein [Deltaproteobacteria bacterium]|nr:MAG: OmpH family outer membrane protein [Deltaproteobacteria bacterium]
MLILRIVPILLICLLGLGTIPVAASASDSAPAPQRLAYVDLQRALNEVAEGQRARQRLEREVERRQNELEREQRALQSFAEELEARIEMLNEQARMEQIQEYQQRAMALQQAFGNHQRELAEAEGRATHEIFERMVTIVREIAEERNYTMVIEKNEASVLYAVDGLEFTDELVRRYNSRHP